MKSTKISEEWSRQQCPKGKGRNTEAVLQQQARIIGL